MSNKTEVIFKILKGEVIALFPEHPGTNNYHATCDSYLHVGQHGAAHIAIARDCKPAKPEQYAPLFKELTNIGYNLKIVRRMTVRHMQLRKAEIERMRGE